MCIKITLICFTGECFWMVKTEDGLGWCLGRKDDGTEGLYPAKYAEAIVE